MVPGLTRAPHTRASGQLLVERRNDVSLDARRILRAGLAEGRYGRLVAVEQVVVREHGQVGLQPGDHNTDNQTWVDTAVDTPHRHDLPEGSAGG